MSKEGAQVWIADIDDGLAASVAGTLQAARHARVDITDDASVAALAEAIDQRHGRLDILVNNAAILDMTPWKALTIESFASVHDVNLFGAVRVTLAMVPLMRKAGGGRILNIASVNGLKGSRDSLSYSTAKGGIVNLTRCLASELSVDNITVNAIAPGFISTRMSILPDGTSSTRATGSTTSTSSTGAFRSRAAACPRMSRGRPSSSAPTTAATSPARSSPSTAA